MYFLSYMQICLPNSRIVLSYENVCFIIYISLLGITCPFIQTDVCFIIYMSLFTLITLSFHIQKPVSQYIPLFTTSHLVRPYKKFCFIIYMYMHYFTINHLSFHISISSYTYVLFYHGSVISYINVCFIIYTSLCHMNHLVLYTNVCFIKYTESLCPFIFKFLFLHTHIYTCLP